VGTERFNPTCGRSPMGRKLRYPILDNGTFGLGSNGASPCHSHSCRDIETRQLSCRRGRCSQCLPRVFRVDPLGSGRGLLRLAVGSKAKQAGGPGRIGMLSKVAELGVCAALPRMALFRSWEGSRFRTQARWMSGGRCTSAVAAEVVGRFWGNSSLRGGCAGAADHHSSAGRWVCERPFCDN